VFFKKNNFFFIFLDCFDILMSKIILKNNIYIYNLFLNKKLFKLQLLSQFQTYFINKKIKRFPFLFEGGGFDARTFTFLGLDLNQKPPIMT
jgi:hypothetical protein